MKVSMILTVALFAMALSACGKKEETTRLPAKNPSAPQFGGGSGDGGIGDGAGRADGRFVGCLVEDRSACVDWIDNGSMGPVVEKSCVKENGTFQPGGCPASRLGSCSFGSGNGVLYVTRFYSGMTMEEAEIACGQMGGSFSRD